MASKEELRTLVEIVEFETGKTRQDIAIAMGYGKTYISEMLGPKGKVSAKFVTQLHARYKEYLGNPKSGKPKETQTEKPPHDEHETVSIDRKYLDLLERQSRILENSSVANLKLSDANDRLAAAAEYHTQLALLLRLGVTHGKEFDKSLHEIHKRVLEKLNKDIENVEKVDNLGNVKKRDQ